MESLQTPSDLFTLAAFFACIGIIMSLLGYFIGKVFRSNEKLYERGLHREKDMDFFEQMDTFHRNPDVMIPMLLVFFGILLILAAFITTIIGVIWLVK